MATAYPETTDQAADIIRGAAGHECLQIIGNGSRYPADAGTPGLSAARISGIRIYRPDDWTITVSAGTPIEKISEIVSQNGQRLAFSPPVDRRFGGSRPEPTIGGAIAANAGDPRIPFCGRVQDSVLGMRFINGSGEIIDAGSRAIKNVAGIALARGLVGSWGNLALICEVTLRLISASSVEQPDQEDRSDAIGFTVSHPSQTANRISARIKRAFDPKGVFSSKAYLSRTAI